MSRVEDRLYSGATLIKTMDQEAPLGCFWTFFDGVSARADICEKLVSDGLLVPANDGLFPGSGQTWRLAPYEGDLDAFITEKFGDGWHVCDRVTPTLKRTYPVLVRRNDFNRAKREYDARRKAA